MNIKDINNIFCIGFPHRVDRQLVTKAQFKRTLPESVEFIEAVDGKKLDIIPGPLTAKGHIGATHSQRNVLQIAKDRGYENFLMLEDDVIFRKDWRNKFEIWSKDIPEDWDMIYLGALHPGQVMEALRTYIRRPVKVTDNVWKLKGACGAHAVIFRHTVFDRFISMSQDLSIPIDMHYASTQETEFNAYVFAPNLAWQGPSWSDIQDTQVSYSRNGWYDYDNNVFEDEWLEENNS